MDEILRMAYAAYTTTITLSPAQQKLEDDPDSLTPEDLETLMTELRIARWHTWELYEVLLATALRRDRWKFWKK